MKPIAGDVPRLDRRFRPPPGPEPEAMFMVREIGVYRPPSGSLRETTLHALGELCGSVIDLSQEFHRRDAEYAELTLRKTIIPTASCQEGHVF